MMDFWQDLEAVVLDMDGVLFIGERLRQGVTEFLRQLEQSGVGYRVLTNTSASTTDEISANLRRMGLPLAKEKITNSSELVAAYLVDRGNVDEVFTVGGGRGLKQALKAAGIKPVDLAALSVEEACQLEEGTPQVQRPLVIGWTRDYTYDLATRVLRLEACVSDIYSTGADRLYAGDAGALPSVRWISGSVEALLGKHVSNPAKPSPFALCYTLQRLGRPASRTAVIGDSISDIRAGNEAGCRTVLVLGGATPAADLENLTGASVPGRVIHELTELL